MPKVPRDLTGLKFGRLSVLRRDGIDKGHPTFLCLCECGNECIGRSGNLVSGVKRSCGCLRDETRKNSPTKFKPKHGMYDTPIYHAWQGMRQRCDNPKTKSFKNYGKRGIRVCERWQDFDNFFSDMGLPEIGQSLDRINNNGNYEPGNCRWADAKTQSRNTSKNTRLTFRGVTKTLVEWSEEYGVIPETIHARFKRGLSEEEIFSHEKIPNLNPKIKPKIKDDPKYRFMIRQARKSKKMKQEDLSLMFCKNKLYIGCIERGTNRLPIELFDKIMKIIYEC